MALHNFSDLTRQTAFMRLWYSRLASISGQQMLMVAVGWQMYELTGSAWDLGLVGLFQFLPALLLTLVAGHVADRLHRARIVLVCLLVCPWGGWSTTQQAVRSSAILLLWMDVQMAGDS